MTIFIFIGMVLIVSMMGVFGNLTNGISFNRWYLMEVDHSSVFRLQTESRLCLIFRFDRNSEVLGHSSDSTPFPLTSLDDYSNFSEGYNWCHEICLRDVHWLGQWNVRWRGMQFVLWNFLLVANSIDWYICCCHLNFNCWRFGSAHLRFHRQDRFVDLWLWVFRL